MHFEHYLGIWPGEEVFAGNLAGSDGFRGYVGLEPRIDHRLRCPKNVFMASQDVDIAVLPDRRVAISLQRECRPFQYQCRNAGVAKTLQGTQHFGNEPKPEEQLQALRFHEPVPKLFWNRDVMGLWEAQRQ